MGSDREPPAVLVARIGHALGARATGLWRVEGDRLLQVAFASGDGLDPDVAARFAAATASVPLDRLELGIVRAVREARAVVSIAAQLPTVAGSGGWLRAFGADRSIAVPLVDCSHAIVAILAIAVPAQTLQDSEIITMIQDLTDQNQPP